MGQRWRAVGIDPENADGIHKKLWGAKESAASSFGAAAIDSGGAFSYSRYIYIYTQQNKIKIKCMTGLLVPPFFSPFSACVYPMGSRSTYVPATHSRLYIILERSKRKKEKAPRGSGPRKMMTVGQIGVFNDVISGTAERPGPDWSQRNFFFFSFLLFPTKPDEAHY